MGVPMKGDIVDHRSPCKCRGANSWNDPCKPGPCPLRIVLYQPDIAPNAGTILRLGACLGVAVDVIEPCGFVFDGPRMRRAGLDYRHMAEMTRHESWRAFLDSGTAGRLILLSTSAPIRYDDFAFRGDDSLLLGRETGGVPDAVRAAAAAVVTIPMVPGRRSLNVAVACAMVLGEALRQTDNLPETRS